MGGSWRGWLGGRREGRGEEGSRGEGGCIYDWGSAHIEGGGGMSI